MSSAISLALINKLCLLTARYHYPLGFCSLSFPFLFSQFPTAREWKRERSSKLKTIMDQKLRLHTNFASQVFRTRPITNQATWSQSIKKKELTSHFLFPQALLHQKKLPLVQKWLLFPLKKLQALTRMWRLTLRGNLQVSLTWSRSKVLSSDQRN